MHVHKESKSLILALRDPGRVTSVVPKARAVPDANGMTWTQVFFGLDEARVLRNMGLPAPPPDPVLLRLPHPPPEKAVRAPGHHRRVLHIEPSRHLPQRYGMCGR